MDHLLYNNMAEQTQDISLDSIDFPEILMRSDPHDAGIDDLTQSIQKIGVFNPIIVRPRGDRFLLVAGRRRILASQLGGKVTIPAHVRDLTDEEALKIMVDENSARQDINPIDEAVFLMKVMAEKDLNIKQMGELTRRSADYIASRLAILEYPDYLIEAVGEKQISLGAAEYLAKITDKQVRRNYVMYAISGGISVKRAIAWYDSWNRGGVHANPLTVAELDEETGVEREVHKELCVICQRHDVPDEMMLYYGHRNCVEKIQLAA